MKKKPKRRNKKIIVKIIFQKNTSIDSLFDNPEIDFKDLISVEIKKDILILYYRKNFF